MILDIKILDNRSGAVEPLMLKGWIPESNDPKKLLYRVCLEETASFFACNAVSNQVIEDCHNAGFETVNCRECKSFCSGKYK
jgi:hypothetical protein